jgi:hypothetical protein
MLLTCTEAMLCSNITQTNAYPDKRLLWFPLVPFQIRPCLYPWFINVCMSQVWNFSSFFILSVEWYNSLHFIFPLSSVFHHTGIPAALCDSHFSVLFLNVRHQNIRGRLVSLTHTENPEHEHRLTNESRDRRFQNLNLNFQNSKWTWLLQIHLPHYIQNKPCSLFPTLYVYDITIQYWTWHSESVWCAPPLCFIFTTFHNTSLNHSTLQGAASECKNLTYLLFAYSATNCTYFLHAHCQSL